MGLDGVELIMAIEEEFKIAVSDAEASESDTVGKVVDLVYARLRHTTEDPCLSQHGFYVVRKSLMEQLGLSRSAIKPDSRLADLIPIDNRHSMFKGFVQELTGEQTVSVTLVRPTGLNRIIVFLFPAVAFALSLVWIPFSFFWIGIIPAFFVLYVGDKLTSPWKTEFHSSCSHVKDLIPFVNTLDSRVWTKEEVFEKIREISVEILGVKPEQVKLESHWVNDLGVD